MAKWPFFFLVALLIVSLLLVQRMRRSWIAPSPARSQSADEIFCAELQRRGMAYRIIQEGLYEIDVQGQKVTANLENVRRDYARDQDADAVVRFVDRVNAITLETTPDWEAVRTVIRYSLEPANYENRFKDILYKSLSDELVQLFVYTSENGSKITWISEAMVRDWGVTREQVIEQADRNMATIVDEAKFEVRDINGSPLGMVSTREVAFNASLVLSPRFRDLVFPTHGWPVCVVVPCRDFAYVVRDGDQNLLGRLGGVVVEEYRKSGYPIARDVLRVSDDGVKAIGTYPDQD